MKFAEELFPKGTFPKQQTDGAYLNETLADNLDILAETIVNDMHHLIIISGHDSVGDGKSTLATQTATYLTWKINKLHNLNNTFESKNIFFTGQKLIQDSHTLPCYSVGLLDEGDELTTHSFKELAVRLKTYFRKCRQLNQILILIIPSFFELPKFYALARSVCLIDVKFMNKFERGFFSFYGSKKKKELYLKGKKEWDYECVRPDFQGRFFSSYCFFPDLNKNIEAYKKAKYEDMVSAEEQLTPQEIIQQTKIELFNKLLVHFKDKITLKELSKAFGFTERTGEMFAYTYPKTRADKREKYNKITNEVSYVGGEEEVLTNE